MEINYEFSPTLMAVIFSVTFQWLLDELIPRTKKTKIPSVDFIDNNEISVKRKFSNSFKLKYPFYIFFFDFPQLFIILFIQQDKRLFSIIKNIRGISPINRRFPEFCTVTLFLCFVRTWEGFLFLLVWDLVYFWQP